MFLRSSFLTVALVVGAWSGAAAAQSPSSEPCFGEYTVTKAVPYRAPVRHGQGTYDQLVGARLYVPAKPGLTGEWLHAELARRANQPRAGTECPLDVPDVNITVRSGGPGFWVGLSTEDTGDAKEVLRRARADALRHASPRPPWRARAPASARLGVPRAPAKILSFSRESPYPAHMSDSQTKLSFVEKAGYSAGDAAANFVFQLLLVFQAGFYTDVMGISAAALGTLLLLVRFADAIIDPVIGAIADRTEHRWGKFRPWIIWSAIPFALMFWAAFTVPPGLSDSGRLLYAAATYTVLMIAYSMNNVPYSALMGVMTGDSSERTSLASYRFVASMAAAFIVQGFTLPLVGKFGGGDDAKGWSLTIAIYAIVAIGFFLITFFTSKERIRPAENQEANLKRDIADLRQNVPWIAMFGMTLFVFITLSLRGGAYYYYFTYYADTTSLRGFMETLGLVVGSDDPRGIGFSILDLFGLVMKPGDDPSKIGFSVFNMTGNLVNILGVLAAKPLADRFGKKAVFTVGLTGATLVQMCFFGLAPSSVGAMFVLQILSAGCYGPTIPLLWAMIGDTADYSEWRTGRRATGFVFAGVVFALKAGLGLGGAISGWLLAAYGYTPETAHDPGVLDGIRWMASLYSAVPFGLGVVCMLFYSITKELNLQMSKELAERRLAQP